MTQRDQDKRPRRFKSGQRKGNASNPDERLDALLLELRDAANDDGDHASAVLFELAHSSSLPHGDAHHRARAAARKALRLVALPG